MITIRNYDEGDTQAVALLIADTYRAFNLSQFPPNQVELFLGPFQHAGSPQKDHQDVLAKVIQSEMVYVAEDDDGEIVGVLRGRKERLASLFVRGDHHRQGIGQQLVEHFEGECAQQGVTVIRLAATLFAVPFYLSMGYKKSTGVRSGWSFEGRGLPIQPMKKVLKQSS
jgi:GNAT superfamily N-acetyltransferase